LYRLEPCFLLKTHHNNNKIAIEIDSLFLLFQSNIDIEIKPTGMYVTKLVGIMFGLIFFLDLFAAIGWSGGLAAFIYFILFIGIFVILLIISRQPQNR